MLRARDYFFSVGFDSLTELGIGVVGAIGEVLELELDAPVPVVVELVVPVPVVLEPVVESAFGASAGAGVGAGVATGGVGAGAGGGVTTFSSFLQAMRPTARMAARRSERFIFFSFRYVRGFNQMFEQPVDAGAAGIPDRHTHFTSSASSRVWPLVPAVITR